MSDALETRVRDIVVEVLREYGLIPPEGTQNGWHPPEASDETRPEWTPSDAEAETPVTGRPTARTLRHEVAVDTPPGTCSDCGQHLSKEGASGICQAGHWPTQLRDAIRAGLPDAPLFENVTSEGGGSAWRIVNASGGVLITNGADQKPYSDGTPWLTMMAYALDGTVQSVILDGPVEMDFGQVTQAVRVWNDRG